MARFQVLCANCHAIKTHFEMKQMTAEGRFRS